MKLDFTMKALLGVVGLALWSLLVAGVVRPRDSPELRRIESRLTAMQTRLADIESDLSELDAALSDLEADVSDLESDVEDLR